MDVPENGENFTSSLGMPKYILYPQVFFASM